jgi:molybdopterin-guanine dinucleotide biosynthesis protein B
MPAVICFVGRPHVGKTTVLEKVIPTLIERGYRVAAVKHSPHPHELDQPGKNSHRLRQTGVEAVITVTPEMTAEYRQTPQPLTLAEVAARYQDCDLVIAEGFNGSPFPTVEVLRSDVSMELRAPAERRVAVVSDAPVEADCRWFSFEEVSALTDFLEEGYVKPALGRSGTRA